MTEAVYDLSVEARGSWIVARLTGDIDLSNVENIEAALRDHTNARPLLVDLSATRYLDSAGVAMLESLRQRGELALVMPTRSILARVLEITAFDQLVPIFDSVEQAMLARPD